MCLLAAFFSPWGIPKGILPQTRRTTPCTTRDVTFKDYNSSFSLISLLPFILAPELSKMTYQKSTVNFDHLGQCNLLRRTKRMLSLREALPSQKYFMRQFI